MGKVMAVCTSPEKGTVKTNVHQGRFIENHGIQGDAHAGDWHRQVSLLSYERVVEFNQRGGCVKDGDFGENLLVSGFDFKALPVGTIFQCGEVDRKSTRLNSSHIATSRMPSSA